MTETEAIAETRILADLFPRTNDTMLDFWTVAFVQYQQPLVRRAVLEYANRKGDFIDRTELRALIENLHGNGPANAEKRAAEKRIVATENELRKSGAARQREFQAVANSFAGINAALAGKSDEELQALKDDVLSRVDRATATMLHLSDPKVGRALRTMMAERVTKGGWRFSPSALAGVSHD